MERFNFNNMKDAPMTPPNSPRREEVSTVTKDTTAAQLVDITRRNEEMWDRMKYKAVPFRGRIILDDNGMRVDNPQGIERFTQRDEELFQNNRWRGPIYDRHGNNVSGRDTTMFNTIAPQRPLTKKRKNDYNGGKKKRRTRNKKNNKKRSNK